MDQKKRLFATNNNLSKKMRMSKSFQPEELRELGVNILSDDDEMEEAISIYNDHDRYQAQKFEENKKVNPVPLSSVTYRRRSSEELSVKPNPFNDLSDEVIMGILEYLDKKSLVALSMTCHRFDRLCHDEVFWPRLNLTSKKLEIDNVGHILVLGVKVLRLNTVCFPSPILSRSLATRLENFEAKVRYLDLSYAVIKTADLALLLSKMRHIVKLSLESVSVNNDVIQEIAKNQDLDTLNMAMVEGLNSESVSLLTQRLHKLESLNLSWTRLDTKAYRALCNELTPRIKHLDISGSHVMLRNEELISLSKRCPYIESLDISDCMAISVGTFRELIKSLPQLKFLGISRCYQLDLRVLMGLKLAPYLETVSAFRLIPDNKLDEVRGELHGVRINKNPLSIIARPTVGIRRTSIWEQPTTD